MKNPNSKANVFTKLFSVFFSGALLLGIGAGVLAYYYISLPSKATKVELVKASGPEFLANKGDIMVFQSKIKNPKGITTWAEPRQIPGVSYHYEEGGDTMIIEAITNLNSPMKINLEVTNNDVSANYTVSITNIVYKQIPINSNYFEFDSTDSRNDTIKGFSAGVSANPWALVDLGYNSLDFSSSDIKYVAGDANFEKSVFNTWKVLKIDLSGLIFQFIKTGSDLYSGDGLFRGYNLSSCIELDLSNTDFASYADTQFSSWVNIYTASETFSGAILNNLYSFNLKNSIFASSTTNTDELGGARIAHYTFQDIFCPNAAILDLDNVVFAAENMGKYLSEAKTGYYTFFNANFYSLTILKMNNTKFAVENMLNLAVGEECQNIDSAYWTFAQATFFSGLKTLDLTKTVFSAPNMSSDGDIIELNTAFNTFNFTYFNSLISLNLEGLNFAHQSNTNYKFASASATFAYSKLNRLKTLNLNNTAFAAENMAKTSGLNGVFTAMQTFESAKMDSLDVLDLSTCVFVTKNMTVENVFSALSTFSSASLRSLTKLNLRNVEFAKENMCYEGNISSASGTFASADLSSVTLLDLFNTKFSASNMWKDPSGSFFNFGSAVGTFDSAKLNVLTTLNFSNTKFSSTEMNGAIDISSVEFNIFAGTFNRSYLPMLKILDISHISPYTLEYGGNASQYKIANFAFCDATLSNCQDIYLFNLDGYERSYFASYIFQIVSSIPTNGTIHWEEYTSTNLRPRFWNYAIDSGTMFDLWTWTNDMAGGNS